MAANAQLRPGPEQVRLKTYIDAATARLTQAGVDSPRLCVEVLARETLGGARETSARMEAGLRFAIREGGRTVGSGVVTEIIE